MKNNLTGTTEVFFENPESNKMIPKNDINDYLKLFPQATPEEFVVTHGQIMVHVPNDKHPTFVAQRHTCFESCYRIAASNPEFIYCEGYAAAPVVPVLHAWLLDRNGVVVDPTWDAIPLEGPRKYFGIPFNLAYVLRAAAARGRYGILDDWQNKWPIFQHSREAFCAESFIAETS